MFKECIGSTPFYGSTADLVFPNIKSAAEPPYMGDVSFISTLRALLMPRMSAEDMLTLHINTRRPNKSVIDGTIDDMFAGILPGEMFTDPANKLIVVDTCLNDDEKNKAIMSKIRRNFVKKFPGFAENEKAKMFFGESFPTSTYVNPGSKTTVIFATGLSVDRLHYLQCAVAVAIPWYFDVDDGITAVEKELIYSLCDKTGGQKRYLDAIQKLASKYDFRTPKIEQYLSGFEKFYEQKNIERLKRNIADYQRAIDQYYEHIREQMRRQRDDQIQLCGYENKLETMDDGGLREYFLANKNLILDRVEDGRMYFGVRGYLNMFDSDFAERVIDNPSSYVYRNTSFGNEDIKKLMLAIFVDRSLKIKSCAKFTIDIDRMSVDAISGDECEEIDYINHLPNPHLYFHSCMNANRDAVMNALKSGNYIGAIEQCCYSMSNLAWSDSTVMKEFMEVLDGQHQFGRNEFIELPDGTMVDPHGAIAWLKKQEESDGEEKETKEGE